MCDKLASPSIMPVFMNPRDLALVWEKSGRKMEELPQDALGEVIGTPFGRHRFKVKGLGEINEKSLEGCAAVFLGSLIPGLIVLGTGAADPCAIPAAWGLAAAIAVLTTITETIAFRSTDNFVIPACNAVLVVIWWHVGLAVDEGNDAYDVLDSFDSRNHSLAVKSPAFGNTPTYALVE